MPVIPQVPYKDCLQAAFVCSRNAVTWVIKGEMCSIVDSVNPLPYYWLGTRTVETKRNWGQVGLGRQTTRASDAAFPVLRKSSLGLVTKKLGNPFYLIGQLLLILSWHAGSVQSFRQHVSWENRVTVFRWHEVWPHRLKLNWWSSFITLLMMFFENGN